MTLVRDSEVRRIIDEQYERARTLLAERQQVLREAASVLLNKEVLTGEAFRAIAARGGQATPADDSGPAGRSTDTVTPTQT